MASYSGGYDCEFVEKPPKIVQSECPICLQIVREPHQADCCGYAFCRVCIEQVKATNKPCPCCKAEKFDKFGDMRLKRTLYEFKVYCTNKGQGCQWVGELSQLDKHLNSNPSKEQQIQGCSFTLLKCLHCSGLVQRSSIQVHQSLLCLKRPFSCRFCKDYDSTYEDVATNHWPVCGNYPLQCQRKCGEFFKRQDLTHHISNGCPLTVVNCEFSHVGCKVKLPRKDMTAHLTENVVKHVSLQANKHKHAIDQLRKENKGLKQEVARLTQDQLKQEEHVARLTQDLQQIHVCTPICSPTFTMNNFEQYKKDNKAWFSPPFYTYPKGYKMCVGIYANGYGEQEGTHTSVGVHLMKGEFDDQLKWPFRGQITTRLLSEVDTSYTEFKHFSTESELRLLTEDVAPGYAHYISHTELQSKYLKNDCLTVSVYQYSCM